MSKYAPKDTLDQTVKNVTLFKPNGIKYMLKMQAISVVLVPIQDGMLLYVYYCQQYIFYISSILFMIFKTNKLEKMSQAH